MTSSNETKDFLSNCARFLEEESCENNRAALRELFESSANVISTKKYCSEVYRVEDPLQIYIDMDASLPSYEAGSEYHSAMNKSSESLAQVEYNGDPTDDNEEMPALTPLIDWRNEK